MIELSSLIVSSLMPLLLPKANLEKNYQLIRGLSAFGQGQQAKSSESIDQLVNFFSLVNLVYQSYFFSTLIFCFKMRFYESCGDIWMDRNICNKSYIESYLGRVKYMRNMSAHELLNLMLQKERSTPKSEWFSG